MIKDNSSFYVLCVLTAIFPGGPGLSSTKMSPFSILLGAKDDGGGGDNWSWRSCKAAVKSSPPTNRHPCFYRPDALPVTEPTVSNHWRESLAAIWLYWIVGRPIQCHFSNILWLITCIVGWRWDVKIFAGWNAIGKFVRNLVGAGRK